MFVSQIGAASATVAAANMAVTTSTVSHAFDTQSYYIATSYRLHINRRPFILFDFDIETEYYEHIFFYLLNKKHAFYCNINPLIFSNHSVVVTYNAGALARCQSFSGLWGGTMPLVLLLPLYVYASMRECLSAYLCTI